MPQPAKPHWQPGPAMLSLSGNSEIHIWRACALDLPCDSNWHPRWGIPPANAPEPVLRARISARRLVDAVLPRYLGGSADSLKISRDANGRPYVAGATLDFNLSHSGDWALLAVASGTRVGVDVEHVRNDRDFRAIARRYFSDSEAQRIRDLVDDDVARGEFYTLWTAKEAALKALGTGIANGLAQTTLSGENFVRLPDGSDMLFRAFEVSPDYPAALASRSIQEFHLQFFHLAHR